MAKVKTIGTVAFWTAVSSSVPIMIFELFVDTVWYSLLATIAICFVSVFIASRYFIKQMVIYKLKPIYRIVTAQKTTTDEIKKQVKSNQDIVDEIHENLSVWSTKREEERKKFQDNERFQREFIGNVSHEIKTPVFTIYGYIQTLIDGALDDPEISRLYLERAGKNLERLTNILTDLDEITRMESPDAKPAFQVFDIKKLVREVFTAFELDAVKHQISLKLGPSASARVMVCADRSRIEQVLINLVSNSVKYGKPGGTTTVNFIDLYEKIMIEVEDDGIGIAEMDQPRVFERFYRVDKSRSREEGGTGLGLPIVKRILDVHDTQLALRSELDKGSVFSFALFKPSK